VLAQQPRASALITDFDGTLSPIIDDPAHARPLPDALHSLQQLTSDLALVAVVSGRPAEFLRESVGVPGLVLVGQYGMERIVDGEIVVDPRVRAYVDAVAAAATEAQRTWPDVFVERKGDIAFTLHWRRSPIAEPPAGDIEALAARHGLVTQPGRMACELRPPVPIDKGTTVEELIASIDGAAAFAGDDRGDLAAFDALDRWAAGPDRAGAAVRIGVQSPEAPAELLDRADVVVDGPSGLAALLRDLVAAVRPPR
jgi:trehalose 6-phosphate phosphatase